MNSVETINRYAAKLIFQFRTLSGGVSNKRRVCEERIIIFMAKTPKIALKSAKKRGKEEEFSYSDDGIEVLFEFIGVIELIELGACSEPDEVWSSLFEKIEPMENINKIIPKEDQLHALSINTNRKKLSVPGKRIKKKAVSGT
ncbi:MAG: DUF4288 domain-containing protein [Geobacteraceae bacterium]|nr:DUF4288 domain-containing protein [Geobacteraceae bacterium]